MPHRPRPVLRRRPRAIRRETQQHQQRESTQQDPAYGLLPLDLRRRRALALPAHPAPPMRTSRSAATLEGNLVPSTSWPVYLQLNGQNRTAHHGVTGQNRTAHHGGTEDTEIVLLGDPRRTFAEAASASEPTQAFSVPSAPSVPPW